MHLYIGCIVHSSYWYGIRVFNESPNVKMILCTLTVLLINKINAYRESPQAGWDLPMSET